MNDVVVVVGAGHVPGITKFWNERIATNAHANQTETDNLIENLTLFPGAIDRNGRTYTMKDMR